MHIGSLATALASWLDARAHGGTWLVRMEDLDRPRNRTGSVRSILDTLAALGLEPDEPVYHQSSDPARYLAALAQLQAQGQLYRCTCRRGAAPYAGTCRDAAHPPHLPAALRLRLAPHTWCFEDRFQGAMTCASEQLGDPVLLRRDNIIAYQLAVVVDDMAQRITDVVRGADLLDSTPWQLAITRALGGQPPHHAHVPLVLEADGGKLSKSCHSLPLDGLSPARELVRALTLLRQSPPAELGRAPPARVLEWAVAHWRPARFSGQRSLRLPQARQLGG